MKKEEYLKKKQDTRKAKIMMINIIREVAIQKDISFSILDKKQNIISKSAFWKVIQGKVDYAKIEKIQRLLEFVKNEI